jgi:hypothetical protein
MMKLFSILLLLAVAEDQEGQQVVAVGAQVVIEQHQVFLFLQQVIL